jgi:hypothetical protein
MISPMQLELKLRKVNVLYFVYKRPKKNSLITLQSGEWLLKDLINLLLCPLLGHQATSLWDGTTLCLLETYCTTPNLPSPSNLLQLTMLSNGNSPQFMGLVLGKVDKTLLIGSAALRLGMLKTGCSLEISTSIDLYKIEIRKV